ncbi:hypothetical protein OHB06_52055 [Streptomyces sp. NBC_01604]|uniref:hypothetical protein n=1 Tax=Streptomyces sp. NBC_01604 TaxID=2975894 RepID=UPI003863A474
MLDDEFVMRHGRRCGHHQPWRLGGGRHRPLERALRKGHWGELQEEAAREKTLSGLPMFCDGFSEER